MDFKNDELGCSFSVSDRPTVRQQLAYVGGVMRSQADDEHILNNWKRALPLITGWKCDAMPDTEIDLETVTDPKITHIVLWAGTQVYVHMSDLERVPPNS